MKKFFILTLLFSGIFLFQGYAGVAQGRSWPANAGRWVAWSKKPATAWQDAFVAGNTWKNGKLQQAVLLPGKNDVCTIRYGAVSKKIQLIAGRSIALDEQLHCEN